MVRATLAAITITVAVVLAAAGPAAAAAAGTITFYGSDNCPFSQELQPFIDTLDGTYPDVHIDRYDVDTAEGADRFDTHLTALGATPDSIPAVIVADQVFLGASPDTRDAIGAAVDQLDEPAGTHLTALDTTAGNDPTDNALRTMLVLGAAFTIGVFSKLLPDRHRPTIVTTILGRNDPDPHATTVPDPDIAPASGPHPRPDR